MSGTTITILTIIAVGMTIAVIAAYHFEVEQQHKDSNTEDQ